MKHSGSTIISAPALAASWTFSLACVRLADLSAPIHVPPSAKSSSRRGRSGDIPEASCTSAILTGFFSNFDMVVIVLLELQI